MQDRHHDSNKAKDVGLGYVKSGDIEKGIKMLEKAKRILLSQSNSEDDLSDVEKDMLNSIGLFLFFYLLLLQLSHLDVVSDDPVLSILREPLCFAALNLFIFLIKTHERGLVTPLHCNKHKMSTYSLTIACFSTSIRHNNLYIWLLTSTLSSFYASSPL